MQKKLLLVFILSFVLNLIWEGLHVQLYIPHFGGSVVSIVLLASLADALIITLVAFCIYKTYFSKWAMVVVGLVVSVAAEKIALSMGLWEYKSAMPIVPLLGVGLSPAIQLAVTGYAALRLSGGSK